MNEHVCCALAREDSPSEPIKVEETEMLDSSDEKLPFDMEQIKKLESATKLDRERVNFVRARLEPEAKMLSPIQSDPIKLEIVRSHVGTVWNA